MPFVHILRRYIKRCENYALELSVKVYSFVYHYSLIITYILFFYCIQIKFSIFFLLFLLFIFSWHYLCVCAPAFTCMRFHGAYYSLSHAVIVYSAYPIKKTTPLQSMPVSAKHWSTWTDWATCIFISMWAERNRKTQRHTRKSHRSLVVWRLCVCVRSRTCVCVYAISNDQN